MNILKSLNPQEIKNFKQFYKTVLKSEIKTNFTFYELMAGLKLANYDLFHLILEELHEKIIQNQDLEFMTEAIIFSNCQLDVHQIDTIASAIPRLAGGDILKLYRIYSSFPKTWI